MKLTKRGKVVFGTLFTLPMVAGLLIGLTAPAVAPQKAEALPAVALHTKPATHKVANLQILRYEKITRFEPKELVGLLQTVGFKGTNLKIAWAIVMKESHGKSLVYNNNARTGDHSYGLFQINMIGDLGPERRAKFGLTKNVELLNPVKNAQIAYYMSGHGTNWSAWKGTRQKVVQDWLAKYPYKENTQAKKAVAKAKTKPKQKQ